MGVIILSFFESPASIAGQDRMLLGALRKFSFISFDDFFLRG